ncbi:AfsR/SARP family transcriptional regulator [Actinophytocola gossypii]|uniref:Winged helix-turn-helix domain-containing protein n=1 Tax=Actinophytocola gossypii TaxID=2812003 RepID=A0ABT2J6Z7_9PSEU|nr:BTAD domain-containing putative transcriptional regulator [Actinophytocola gossypii]MCT2583633.1 winged helix-turn-helix domain-containing protein [Actinophytocola gossypii]
MQRALLASLLSRSGSAVPVSTIVDDLWGHTPPRTAVNTIRNYVRRLRSVFPQPVLRSTTAGYRLDVRSAQVDVHRFTQLIEDASAAESLALFDQALALWRGDPLTNIAEVPLRTLLQPRLEEVYLGGVERMAELRLRHGRHAELIAGLIELNGQYPLRERLCQQLMIALYREGRAVDALARYRRLRDRLVTELGMEPGPELRRLEAAILREDEDLLASVEAGQNPGPGRAHRPDQLPPLVVPFVGRADDVRELMDRFATSDGSPVHCLLYGQGGAGKSALAVRLGHELSGRYRDGVLYTDLGGSTPGLPTRSPAQVIAGLMTGLGGAEPGPDVDLGTLVRSYRARLRGRRVLIIVDNVVSAQQVQAALPDEPGCALIATSRVAISGGDTVFHVDPLSGAAAVDLLGRVAGARRVRDEPAAARAIATLCGRLPLALRLIASRAALRPHWSLETWQRLLDDERGRLDLLRHEDVDVRASFLIGLDGLRTSDDPVDQDAASLFPLLGLLSPPYLTAALVAALTGWPLIRAEQALEALLTVQMVYSPEPDTYACYDLISLLAKERAAELPADVRVRALRRANDWYMAAVRGCGVTATGTPTEYGLPQSHRTDNLVTVHFERYDEVRRWLDRELPVIVALVRQGAAAGEPTATEAARTVLLSARFYLNSAVPWTLRAELSRVLLDHDQERAAFAYVNLAVIEGQRGNLVGAQRFLDRANDLLDEDDLCTLFMCHNNQGIVRSSRGDQEGAMRRFERALRVAERSGLRILEVVALTNIADTRTRTGFAGEALPLLERALAISREIGHQVEIAIVLNTILQAYAALDEHAEVIRRAPEVLAQHELLGDAHQRAEHLLTVSKSFQALGLDAAAAEHLAEARSCIAAISTREQIQASALFDHVLTNLP